MLGGLQRGRFGSAFIRCGEIRWLGDRPSRPSACPGCGRFSGAASRSSLRTSRSSTPRFRHPREIGLDDDLRPSLLPVREGASGSSIMVGRSGGGDLGGARPPSFDYRLTWFLWWRQTMSMKLACASDVNRVPLKHSPRKRRPTLSTTPFCIGFPGAIKCHSTWQSCDQPRIADEVSSVPLSLTTIWSFARSR